MPVRRSHPQHAASMPPEFPRLPAEGALDILIASHATASARMVLAIMLLCADRYGVVTGHAEAFGAAAGVDKLTASRSIRRLVVLGEITQLRKALNRRPGMWHISAL